MVKKKDKAALDVEVQFRDRRLLLEALKIVPSWVWGAAIWYLFTKLVLDRLSKNKPGTEINLAIIGGDLLPSWAGGEIINLPPGVKIGALIDVTLAALDVVPKLEQYADEIIRAAEKAAQLVEKYPPAETGRPSPEVVGALYTLQKYVIVGIGIITGALRK